MTSDSDEQNKLPAPDWRGVFQRWINIIVTIGGVGTVAFWIIQWAQPSVDMRILWWSESKLIATPSANFIEDIKVDGTAITSRIYETVITVWRTDGIPIKKDDVRGPLTFKAGQGSRILKIVPISQESVVGDKFKLLYAADVINLYWSVFDPKMATKFSVLMQGNDGVIVATDVGPNIVVQSNLLSLPQYTLIVLVDVAIIGALHLALNFMLLSHSRQMLALVDLNENLSTKKDEMFGLYFRLTVVLRLFSLPLVSTILFNFFRPEVPLPLSSVLGL